jgi:exonuclease III
MKIATFNINNINRRLPNLLQWLHQAKPDVVALQELKSTDDDFPLSAINKADYGAVWRGQKTWNGVAILARDAEPVLTRTDCPATPATTRRAISRPPSTASSSPASICRTAIHSRGRNSTTSSTGSNGCGPTPRSL